MVILRIIRFNYRAVRESPDSDGLSGLSDNLSNVGWTGGPFHSVSHIEYAHLRPIPGQETVSKTEEVYLYYYSLFLGVDVESPEHLDEAPLLM